MDDPTDLIEGMYSELDSAACFMRGILFDQRVPQDTRDALAQRINRIDEKLVEWNDMMENA